MTRRDADRGHVLFVYGTLLCGESNHGLLGRAPLLGPAATEPAYALVDLGGYPALVEGGTTAVAGELYAVDDETLARVDRLEGHPDYYCRQTLRLRDGRCVEGYVLPAAEARGCPVVPSGDWRQRRELAG